MTTQEKSFERFKLAERVEHILLLISFTTLGLTGLIQKYSGAGISLWLLDALGGVTTVRLIHRVAATLFLLETVYHFVVIGYKLYVRRVEATMLPGLQDLKDGVQAVGYNLGMAKARPRLGRYTFDEKVEYWAMMWGNTVMIITGFMLWNPIVTTKSLPGVIIPAAKAAHGGEAVLAVLAILVWHVYHVHIKHFNKSMFTGKLTRHEMEEEHGLELAKIEGGTGAVKHSPEVLKRRKAIFFPLAGLVSLAALAGVYWFTTVEATAISTLPPAESAQVIALAPTSVPTAAPSPIPAPTQAAPAAAPATAVTWEGAVAPLLQAKCAMCHGASGGLSMASYADLMKGGAKGPVILAGDPAGSPLVLLMEAGGHMGQLTPDELATVKTWIEAGAPEK